MRAKIVLLVLLIILAVSLIQKDSPRAATAPLVYPGGIVNAASFAAQGLPNASIAQGSQFVIFGQNLGPAILQGTGLPLQTQLAGTSVRVTVAGTTVNALLVYTLAGQVAALLPSQTPAGAGTLVVTYNNQTSAAQTIQVAPSSFGVFTRNQAGSGPAIVQEYNSASDQPINSVLEPAHPGQVMILWGTGLGPVTFDETQPPQVQNLNVDAQVYVGGKSAAIQYKGRSPQFPGVDQVNFQLPSDVVTGCYVPVAVRVNGVLSNFGSIAIAPSGAATCSDPHGFTTADLQRIQQGGSLNVAWIQMVRLMIHATTFVPGMTVEAGADFGFGDFFQLNGSNIRSSPGTNAAAGFALDTCTTVPNPANLGPFYVAPSRPSRVNVGSSLILSGPAGTKVLPWRSGSGIYDRQPLAAWAPGASIVPTPKTGTFSPFLEPGAFTVNNGAGTSATAAFQSSLNVVAQPITWLNRDALTAMDHTQDLTVYWSTATPVQSYVVIAGANAVPTFQSPQVVGMFVCVARPEEGTFTIPSYLIAALPQASGQTFLGVGLAPYPSSNRFMTTGIDAGYFTSMYVLVRDIPLK